MTPDRFYSIKINPYTSIKHNQDRRANHIDKLNITRQIPKKPTGV